MIITKDEFLPSFEALFYEDRLHILNRRGDVGIITLWTPIPAAKEFLTKISYLPWNRIAVIANLYGEGFPQMIRNLLWNPQIKNIFIFGQDNSNSAIELLNLLTLGVEQVERFGEPRLKIKQTNRHLDALYDYNILVGKYNVFKSGLLTQNTEKDLLTFLNSTNNTDCSPNQTFTRINVPLPKYEPKYFPTNVLNLSSVGDKPLDVWEDLVFKIMRFGIPSTASKTKSRLEVLNYKAVIMEPGEEKEEHLQKYGYLLEDLKKYARSLFETEAPSNSSDYTYANRLENGKLSDAILNLINDKTSRSSYVTLWKSDDILSDSSVPCFVSVFFRYFEEKLHMTATFRAHNTMSAWLKNAYGLMAIQKHVADTVGLPVGPLTIISNSISIDPDANDKIELAKAISAARKDGLQVNRDTGKRELKEDPNGFFVIEVDKTKKEIVAILKTKDLTLVEYRGKKAYAIEKQIARDYAVSDIGHAMYIGRTLAECEQELKHLFSDFGPEN